MNQQRKSIYALRRQVLSGQYRSEPTKDERERGIEPVPLVDEADPRYLEMVGPMLENVVKIPAADPLPQGSTPEQQQAWQKEALSADLATRKQVAYQNLEQV